MYPVSARFLEALLQSGHRKTTVDVYYSKSSTPAFTNMAIESCSIKVDRLSDIRRSGSISISDASLFSALGPWGVELVIKTGPDFPDMEELVPIGVFIVDTDSYSLTSGGKPKVEIFDRAHRVNEMAVNIYPDDTVIAGESVRSVISKAIDGAAPGYPSSAKWITEFDPLLPNPTIPGGFDAGNDRWALAKKSAEILGAEVYFDVNGDPQCRPTPSFDRSITQSQSVWDVRYGVNLIDLERKASRSNVYNGVTVRGGQLAGDSVGAVRPFALAVDNDPRSLTYWNGQFGKKTKEISNEGIKDSAAAYALALSELEKSLLLTYQVTISCLANPALEVGDIISLYETSTQTNPTLCIVDGFQWDSNYSDFKIDARTLYGQ